MATIRDKIKDLVRDTVNVNGSSPTYRKGTISSLNNDGTAVAMLDGNAVPVNPMYPVVVGQDVALVFTNGQAAAIPFRAHPALVPFEHPPYFTGGLFRFAQGGVPTNIAQFMAGFPAFTGQHWVVGTFQDAFNSKVYVLRDTNHFFGASLQVQVVAISPNGEYFGIVIYDINNDILIFQSWKIGQHLTETSIENDIQQIFDLKATKVLEFTLPTFDGTEDLGMYPISGRFLPPHLIGGSSFSPFFDATINQWVLATSSSLTTIAAWLPNGDDLGPQYELFPDSTFSGVGINFKAFGVTLNTLLDSGEFTSLDSVATLQGTTYDVQGQYTTGLNGILDLKVDNKGTLSWLQSRIYSARVVSDTTSFVTVGFVIPDAVLKVVKNSGYYLYSQPVTGPKSTLGFWPDAITNTPLNTDVTWNTTIGGGNFQAGNLFFFLNREQQFNFQPLAIFDIETPRIVVKLPINSDAGTAFPPTLTGSFHYSLIRPFVAGNPLTKSINYTATNFSLASSAVSYNYIVPFSIPLDITNPLLIPTPTQGKTGISDRTLNLITFLMTNLSTDPVSIFEAAPSASGLATLVTFSNPQTDFYNGVQVSGVHAILKKSSGNILDLTGHVYAEVLGTPPSFDLTKKLNISPNQVDPTLIRIFASVVALV